MYPTFFNKNHTTVHTVGTFFVVNQPEFNTHCMLSWDWNSKAHDNACCMRILKIHKQTSNLGVLNFCNCNMFNLDNACSSAVCSSISRNTK